MNADLTINSIVFKKSFDTEDSSKRQDTTRGIATPDVMSIRSQYYTDSVTKVSGRRHTVRLDRTAVDSNGAPYVNSAYVVIAIPHTSATSDLTAILATFRAMVAASGLLEAVANEEK